MSGWLSRLFDPSVLPQDYSAPANQLGPLARQVMANPVGTEQVGQQSVGMPRGGFDPLVDPSVARWPGRPMTQSEYDAMRTGSLDLFNQAALVAGSPAAEEGAAVGAIGRRPVPMEAGPQVPPTGGGPEVWAPQPYTVAPIYSRSSVASQGQRTWLIKDYRGERAGGIDTTWNPDTGNLHVDSIDSEGGPNAMGIAAIRQLRSALLAHYPEAKTLTGLRISGATYADRGGVGPGREAIQYVEQQ